MPSGSAPGHLFPSTQQLGCEAGFGLGVYISYRISGSTCSLLCGVAMAPAATWNCVQFAKQWQQAKQWLFVQRWIYAQCHFALPCMLRRMKVLAHM